MSFIADILGAAVDAGTSMYNAKVQKDINAQNHKWAVEAENREREYNSPVAQMQRLKDAGLNPNLIYGSSANTGNLNARTSTAEAPQLSFNALDRIRAFREKQMQDRQMENLDVQNDLTRQQTKVAKAQERINNANADVAEHDAKVVSKRPDMLSSETWSNAAGRDVYSWIKGKIPTTEQALDTVRGWKNRLKDWATRSPFN